MTHYLATAYQASIYQTKTGLTNGVYTLSAWVKNGGGQKTVQLYAKNFGGAEMDYALPVTDVWTQIQLTGIQVANGQLELGLWSDANAGNYASIDNVELYRTDVSAAPLPVRLVSFEATPAGDNRAVLRWKTATELNSAFFAVERSGDGRTFDEIGRMPAAGNSIQARTYELRDPHARAATTYYRLRQVDSDGSATYSRLVVLSAKGSIDAGISLYPNPSHGTGPARLALRGLAGRPVVVQVADLLGRVVARQQLTPATDLAQAEILVPAATAAGLYVLSASDGTRTWTTRWSREP